MQPPIPAPRTSESHQAWPVQIGDTLRCACDPHFMQAISAVPEHAAETIDGDDPVVVSLAAAGQRHRAEETIDRAAAERRRKEMLDRASRKARHRNRAARPR